MSQPALPWVVVLCVAAFAARAGAGAAAPASSTPASRAPVSSPPDAPPQDPGADTVVHSARPADIDDARVTPQDAVLTPAPEDAVGAALGASLVHDGGPLAPSRAMVRGLSGARLDVFMGGLPLSDPATGLVDTAALPWAAVDSILVESGATGGAAGALHLAPSLRAGLRSRTLVGSLGTVRMSVAAADTDHSAAADVGLSRGDFTFVPTSSVGDAPGEPLVRQNNDQRRASVFAATRARMSGWSTRVLSYGAIHDGGIPGLATRPTDALRGSDATAGARILVERPLASGRVGAALDGRAAHRATWGPTSARTAVESIAGGMTLQMSDVVVGPARLDVGAGAGAASLLDGRFGRTQASGRIAARLPAGDVRAASELNARVVSDAGLLVGGNARLEVGESVRASIGVARAARAPTLDELYAPRGLVLGNEDLRPETFNDVEVAFAFMPGATIDARLVGFAGLIEDGIAWTNRNAYDIAPVNLGCGWRSGVDASASIEPTAIFGLDVTAGLFWSRLDGTGEPLPLAPPFHARLALRLGHRARAHLTAVVHSRGAAPSNLYGTLVAAPYTLVDLLASIPLTRSLSAGVAITNAFDVLDARDANQLPLPGRLVFLSLEVRA